MLRSAACSGVTIRASRVAASSRHAGAVKSHPARPVPDERNLVKRAIVVLTLLLLIPANAYACKGIESKWCGKRHSRAYNKRVLREIAKKHGYSTADIKRLNFIAKRESHWGNRATNGPCKGMFQVNTRKPISKWANPYWNTNRAIHYIKKRYGSPAGAVRHIGRTGWY